MDLIVFRIFKQEDYQLARQILPLPTGRERLGMVDRLLHSPANLVPIAAAWSLKRSELRPSTDSDVPGWYHRLCLASNVSAADVASVGKSLTRTLKRSQYSSTPNDMAGPSEALSRERRQPGQTD